MNAPINNETRNYNTSDAMDINVYPEEDVLQFAATIAEKRLIRLKRASMNIPLIAQYCQYILGHLDYEVMAAVWINKDDEVVAFERHAHGNYHGCAVIPSRFVQSALTYNAKQICAVHNHPSSILVSSTADVEISRKLDKALNVVAVDLIGHIIVSSSSYSTVDFK